MATFNKYDGVRTDVMIRCVQDEVRKSKDPKTRKKTRTQSTIKKMQELREMQYQIQLRLKNMNRLDPLFFPKDCYVEFNKYENLKVYHDEGQVIGHEDGYVIVQFDNDKEVGGTKVPVKVEPRYLKLLYIRQHL